MSKKVKWIIIVVLGLAAIGAIFGNSDDKKDEPKQEVNKTVKDDEKKQDVIDFTKKDAEEEKVEEKVEEDNSADNTIEIGKTISFDKFDITITKVEKVKDYNSKPVLKLTYTWTNKSEKTTAPFMTFTLKGFQDGVETDNWIMSDSIDLGIGQKQIKPGATIENCEAGLMITDESKPIDIELLESFSFNNTVYSMTLNPNEL